MPIQTEEKFMTSDGKVERGAKWNTCMANGQHPKGISTLEAISMYRDHLSAYEKREILRYDKIYYIGQILEKSTIFNSYVNTVQKQRAKLPSITNHHSHNDNGHNNNHNDNNTNTNTTNNNKNKDNIINGQILSANDLQSFYNDSENFYRIIKHDHIAYRYEILTTLGKGSFGQVVSAFDHMKGCRVALKIIRTEPRFTRQAREEIKILETLRNMRGNCSSDSNGPDFPVVQLFEHFTFRKHICMTFELLNINLYDLLKMNKFIGLPRDRVRRITYQILRALKFIQQAGIIHCDLKPENVLLVWPQTPDKESFYSNNNNNNNKNNNNNNNNWSHNNHNHYNNNENIPDSITNKCTTATNLTDQKDFVKLIDFGSSCFPKDQPFPYIQSRFYRAPEILLRLGYDQAIDIWSFGCLIAELINGLPLFPGEDESDQMACIMEVLGLPHPTLLRYSSQLEQYFTEFKINKLKKNTLNFFEQKGIKLNKDLIYMPRYCSIRYPSDNYDSNNNTTTNNNNEQPQLLPGISQRNGYVRGIPNSLPLLQAITQSRLHRYKRKDTRSVSNLMSNMKSNFFENNNNSNNNNNIEDENRKLYLDKDNQLLVDLIASCLTWLPSERIKPNKGLQHDWFKHFTWKVKYIHSNNSTNTIYNNSNYKKNNYYSNYPNSVRVRSMEISKFVPIEKDNDNLLLQSDYKCDKLSMKNNFKINNHNNYNNITNIMDTTMMNNIHNHNNNNNNDKFEKRIIKTSQFDWELSSGKSSNSLNELYSLNLNHENEQEEQDELVEVEEVDVDEHCVSNENLNTHNSNNDNSNNNNNSNLLMDENDEIENENNNIKRIVHIDNNNNNSKHLNTIHNEDNNNHKLYKNDNITNLKIITPNDTQITPDPPPRITSVACNLNSSVNRRVTLIYPNEFELNLMNNNYNNIDNKSNTISTEYLNLNSSITNLNFTHVNSTSDSTSNITTINNNNNNNNNHYHSNNNISIIKTIPSSNSNEYKTDLINNKCRPPIFSKPENYQYKIITQHTNNNNNSYYINKRPLSEITQTTDKPKYITTNTSTTANMKSPINKNNKLNDLNENDSTMLLPTYYGSSPHLPSMISYHCANNSKHDLSDKLIYPNRLHKSSVTIASNENTTHNIMDNDNDNNNNNTRHYYYSNNNNNNNNCNDYIGGTSYNQNNNNNRHIVTITKNKHTDLDKRFSVPTRSKLIHISRTEYEIPINSNSFNNNNNNSNNNNNRCIVLSTNQPTNESFYKNNHFRSYDETINSNSTTNITNTHMNNINNNNNNVNSNIYATNFRNNNIHNIYTDKNNNLFSSNFNPNNIYGESRKPFYTTHWLDRQQSNSTKSIIELSTDIIPPETAPKPYILSWNRTRLSNTDHKFSTVNKNNNESSVTSLWAPQPFYQPQTSTINNPMLHRLPQYNNNNSNNNFSHSHPYAH